MARSLTVLLPVQDVQSTLAETVLGVLEAAADLSEHFELLIIDDGSRDATSEVAHDLTRHYPQVRTLRHSRPMGRDAALRTGLAESQGDVMVAEGPGSTSFQRLHWASRPTRPNYLGSSPRLASGANRSRPSRSFPSIAGRE